MFMDLSKAFDAIHPDFIISKLGTCGFSWDALQYMRSYSTNRQQRVTVNTNFRTWENITAEVLQDSKLESLLSIVFINDLFLFV